MSNTAQALVVTVLVLATSIWVGGYVAIAVVANTAIRTLETPTRVAFFRALGRTYFWVGAPALMVALIAGGVLVRNSDADGLLTGIGVVVAVLLASFAVAVGQARRMTRLRERLVASPGDAALQSQVTRGGRGATALRGMLGLLSMALVVLGSVLAVR